MYSLFLAIVILALIPLLLFIDDCTIFFAIVLFIF